MAKVTTQETRTRQFNVQFRKSQEDLMLYYARTTDSVATSGPTKGEYSIGALLRRISDGEITLVHNGKKLMIPPFMITK